MKAKYKIDAVTILEVEGENLAEILDQLSGLRNAIGPEPCGKCKSINTQWRVRRSADKEYTFYEVQCQECWAVLELGQHKNGEMYKKRMKTDAKGKTVKDENDKGIQLPDKGWLKYNKEKDIKE